jgi:hypothetical protein
LADWKHDVALEAIGASPSRENEGGFSSEILAADLEAHVVFLASDELEGRMTGTKGAQMAAAHIAERLAEAGIEPLGDSGDYFQEFPFTSGVEIIPDENHLVTYSQPNQKEGRSFELDTDFRPLAFAASGDVDGQVVFAGYGLTTPGDNEQSYDSYAGLDVKDKIALVLRYVPEDVGTERRAELNLYSGIRYKAMLAREAGAKALQVVTGPNSPNAGASRRIRAWPAPASSSLPLPLRLRMLFSPPLTRTSKKSSRGWTPRILILKGRSRSPISK